jgi:hypothetical protein
MRFLTLGCLLGTVLAAVITMSGVCSPRNTSKHECVSFAEASNYVGTTQCVSGTVPHVAEGTNGVSFLTFCQDHKTSSFTVVVFPDDPKKVGDIQKAEWLKSKVRFKITTDVRRSFCVTRNNSAKASSSSFLWRPTDYGVEQRGHDSAGKYSHPKAKKTTKKQGGPISIEDPGERQQRAALTIHAPHTNPLRNSSSGYFVPRHTMPSFQSV